MNHKQYKINNGTSYDNRTPDEVVKILERSRLKRTRLHISLGDTGTGRDWLEEHDVFGHVGRSMGQIKVPLLIANKRSLGGPAILDHCIVRIRIHGKTVFQHPKYHFGELTIRQKEQQVSLPNARILNVDLLRDGQVHACFESIEKARRWLKGLGLNASLIST